MNKTLAGAIARVIQAHDSQWTTQVLGGYRVENRRVPACVFATNLRTGNIYYLGDSDALQDWFRIHEDW